MCQNWRKAAIHCLSLLRELQYRLPTGQLAAGYAICVCKLVLMISVSEKKVLWTNRYHWAGHSKWMIQLLKVVDWNNRKDAAQGSYKIVDLIE